MTKRPYTSESWNRFAELLKQLTSSVSGLLSKSTTSDSKITNLEREVTNLKNKADKDTTYDPATETTDGLMSKEDKKRLDGINDYTTGINLLMGTKDFAEGKNNPYSNFNYKSDGFYNQDAWTKSIDEEGYAVLTANRSGLTSNSVSVSAASLVPCSLGEQFTLSVDFKTLNRASIDGGSIISCIAYKITDDNLTQVTNYDLPTSKIPSYDGIWNQIVFHINIDVDADIFVVRLRIGKNGNLNFRKLKLERGNINNPIWSPSPFDIDRINDETTGINLLRGTRDFVKGTHVIEGASGSNRFDDGFDIGSIPTFYKDEQGFTVAKISRSGLTSASAVAISQYKKIQEDEIITVSLDIMVDDISALDSDYIFVVGLYTYPEMTAIRTNELTLKELIPNAESGKWYTVKRQFSLNMGNRKECIFMTRVLLNKNGSVNFRKIGAYKGYINNPVWSASPFDSKQTEENAAYAADEVKNIRDIYAPKLLGTIPNSRRLVENFDIHTLTKPGTYACVSDAIAKTIVNRPNDVANAFKIDVEYTLGSSDRYLRHILTIYTDTAKQYIEYSNNNGSTWSSWREVVNNKSIIPTNMGGTGVVTLQELRKAMGLGDTLGALPEECGGTGNTTGRTSGNVVKLITNESFRAVLPDGYTWDDVAKVEIFQTSRNTTGTKMCGFVYHVLFPDLRDSYFHGFSAEFNVPNGNNVDNEGEFMGDVKLAFRYTKQSVGFTSDNTYMYPMNIAGNEEFERYGLATLK